ncbi:lectin L6-like [Acanthaster planci]|uniref:Lectin L6-like n=1 Tax=Acanthaster planci TaxID=133434 RepID=A0A8B7YJG6_ACAPL|nr:lectin L6-like [Acanthaster planci]
MVFKYLWLLWALCIMGEELGPQSCENGCRLATTSWTRINGGLKHVSVGNSGVWGVNHKNQIYYKGNSYGEEESATCEVWVGVSGALKQLDVGKNVVWGVNVHDYIYYRRGISATKPKGTDWARIPGALKHVSVSQRGHVWGVNKQDYIYHRIGASNCNPAGDSWLKLNGRLKQISVGSGGVWGVNSADSIYYRVGTYGDPPSDPNGSGWKHIAGKLKYISSADTIYGVNSNNNIYYRVGVSEGTPWGTSWKKISGGLKQIESLSCVVWGVNRSDNIYKKKTDG